MNICMDCHTYSLIFKYMGVYNHGAEFVQKAEMFD